MHPCSSLRHGNRQGRAAPRSAFTLIELLATVTIIAILTALIIPVVGMVRVQAESLACRSNLRQLGMANMGYAIDNDGFSVPANYENYPIENGKTAHVIWSTSVLLGPYMEKEASTTRGSAGIIYGCKGWKGWYAPLNLPGYQWDLANGNALKDGLAATRYAAGYAYNDKPNGGGAAANGYVVTAPIGIPRPRFYRLAQITSAENRMAFGDANYWDITGGGSFRPTDMEYHVSSSDLKGFSQAQIPGMGARPTRHNKQPNWAMFSGRVISLNSSDASKSYNSPATLSR